MHQRTEQEIMKNWKDDMEYPIVSICCTTYNHEPYIAEAINGFLMQETDFPFEILIRDDCSTDKTASIVKVYTDKYPSLIKPIFEKENSYSKGVKPMLQLYKIVKGKYIALCEGDDYWTDPLKLKKQVDYLEENEEYVCCFHNSKVIDKEGLVITQSLLGNPKDYNEMELLSTEAFITVHSVMFRNVLQYPNKLKVAPFGDMVLWHLLGFYGRAKYLSNIGKAAYRKHDGGVWSSLDKLEKFEKTLFSIDLIRDNLFESAISLVQIDVRKKRYIMQNLYLALKMKDYSFYKNIIILLRGQEYSYLNLVNLHIQAFSYKVKHIIKDKF